jgi:hypothetical protein
MAQLVGAGHQGIGAKKQLSGDGLRLCTVGIIAGRGVRNSKWRRDRTVKLTWMAHTSGVAARRCLRLRPRRSTCRMHANAAAVAGRHAADVVPR